MPLILSDVTVCIRVDDLQESHCAFCVVQLIHEIGDDLIGREEAILICVDSIEDFLSNRAFRLLSSGVDIAMPML